jgi:hypothetical protein
MQRINANSRQNISQTQQAQFASGGYVQPSRVAQHEVVRERESVSSSQKNEGRAE